MPDRPTARTAAVAVVLALPLLAAACGDDDAPPPPAPSPTEALWNPCDALDAATVAQHFGGRMKEANGTPTEPLCSFTPVTRGDPVLDANYRLYPAGLDEAFEQMGSPHGAAVTTPEVPAADDARLVVAADDANLYVSGFVQNGDLIQTVDAVDPEPHDRRRLVDAVTWALRRLAQHARRLSAAVEGAH